MRKIAAALVLAILPLAGTYVYVWMWRDFYFPDRYEDAYYALAMAALASAAILAAAMVIGLVRAGSLIKRG